MRALDEDNLENNVSPEANPHIAALLKQSKLLLDSFVQHAVIMLQKDGLIVRWNPDAEQLWGWKKSEVMGKDFALLFRSEETQSGGLLQKRLEEAAKAGNSECTVWQIHKTGSRFWAEVHILASRDTKGIAQAFSIVVRNLNDKKEVISKLQENEQKFKWFSEFMGGKAVFIIDDLGIIKEWNKGAERLLGYSNSEVIGKDFGIFYVPEIQATGKHQADLKIARVKGIFQENIWCVTKLGKKLWAKVALAPIYDEEKNVSCILTMINDLTQRREMQESLSEAAAQSRLFSEHAVGCAAIRLDADGRVIGWNQAAERLTGYEGKTILRNRNSHFYTQQEKDSSKPQQDLKNAAEKGVYESDCTIQRANGLFFNAKLVYSAIKDASGNVFGYVLFIKENKK